MSSGRLVLCGTFSMYSNVGGRVCVQLVLVDHNDVAWCLFEIISYHQVIISCSQ
jgi:hypothetical protein